MRSDGFNDKNLIKNMEVKAAEIYKEIVSPSTTVIPPGNEMHYITGFLQEVQKADIAGIKPDVSYYQMATEFDANVYTWLASILRLNNKEEILLSHINAIGWLQGIKLVWPLLLGIGLAVRLARIHADVKQRRAKCRYRDERKKRKRPVVQSR